MVARVQSSVVDQVRVSARKRNSGCRITTDIYFGEISAVVLESDLIRMTVLAGRGADVVEYLYKPIDLDLVWLTQWGIPTKQTKPDYPADVQTFLEGYPGGWQSIFPNGGAPSSVNGIDFAQHDEVALLAWDYEVLSDSADLVAVEFRVETKKTPFRFTKSFTLKKNAKSVEISESAENLSDGEELGMWGFHFSYGAPFLDEGSIIKLPNNPVVIPNIEAVSSIGRRLGSTEEFRWPIGKSESGSDIDFAKLPPRGEKSEMLYIKDLSEGWYQVENPTKKIGVKVSWDLKTMPYLWYWQEYGGASDAPWFGKHYNIGLEPFSSYPTNGLADAITNGSALRFAPHEKKTSTIEFEAIEL